MADDDRDARVAAIIDRVARVAGSIGLGEVRVRWKLIRFQQWLAGVRARSADSVAHVRYEHLVCPTCGRIADREAQVCSGCQSVLGSRRWQVLERLGVAIPGAVSMSSILAVVMLVVYGRMMMAEPGGGIWGFELDTLLRFGAHTPFLVQAGQWWRLGTAVYLHIGIWHLGFNLMALAQVGPAIEGIFGRGLFLFAFMATGVLGNVGSALFGLRGVSAGASGALMGLVGLAAAWGLRDGTSIGRNVRDRMLKWALYVMLFGVFIGADNGAHFAGFIAGGALGLMLDVHWLQEPAGRRLVALLTAIGAVGIALFAWLAIFPPG